MSNSNTLGGASERARDKQGRNQDLQDLIAEEEVDPDKKIRYTIDFPPDLHQLLRRIAFEEDRSQKDVMLDALQMYANQRGY